MVGVISTLPLKNASMLLGNDLAGGKVIPEHKLVMEPVKSAETDKIEEEISDVIPSCWVTQAQASTMVEDTRASIDIGDKRGREKKPRSTWMVTVMRTNAMV